MRPRVLVVGGNLAGMACARALSSRHFAVTVADPGEWLEWLPNIHELVSGVRRPHELRLSRQSLLSARGHAFRRARVSSLDGQARVATLDDGQRLAWDYAVIACGGVNATRGVPGADVHALPFKSVTDAARIAARLDACTSRPRVALVGAGIEGIEVLGELLRRADRPRITLVDSGTGFLGGRWPALDTRLREHLAGDDVDLRFRTRVRRVDDGRLLLDDGNALDCDLCIWTGGVAPPSWLGDSALAGQGGWIAVDENLRAGDRLFACGDVARPPQALPHQAYHALAMGEHVAGNLAAQARGQALKPFRPAPKPMLVSFGARDTFLVAGDEVVASPLLAAAKALVWGGGIAALARSGNAALWAGTGRDVLPGLAQAMLPLAAPGQLLSAWRQSRWL